MKKKIIVLSVVAVLVLSMGAVAFAETTTNVPSWFKDMISWKKERVNEAVKSEQITEEQAKILNERIEYMEKYHEENGFNFPENCLEGNGRGMRRGFGRGMMNGQGQRMMNGFGLSNR